MKKRLALLFVSVVIATVAAFAENYPYRGDYLWVTVPDHADWNYTTGDDAKVEVQLYKYGIPVDGVEVEYAIGGDLMAADKTGTVTLKNGRATVDLGTMTTPGFRDCRLKATVDGSTTAHHVKVGFSPEKIEPVTELPADFKTFWDNNLAELAKVPLSYTVTPIERYSTDDFNAYLVKINVNSRRKAVYGYLFMPVDAEPGSCPVVLCPPGAGIKTIKDPLRHRYYPENGIIRLELEIHGLNPEMSDEQFNEISNAFNASSNGYLTNNLDDRDNYYMKWVYLGMVRAIDMLTSLPEWDGKNVIVQGGSQGGALAIVTAALDNRVNACVANYPALADMAGYTANRADGYPHFSKIPGMDTSEKRQTMAYYDVVNFARQLTCPVFMTWGYNDNTCPPTTSWATYNVITAPKEARVTPINEHWASDATERAHLDWIKTQLK
ncbi:MAG: acetylxylan esterase [Muribaculaceae bacterium]|nr:acetylxylan esterase [Muribaculaceae bacterium]